MKNLEQFPFLSFLTKEEKERFISLLKPMSVPKGKILHYQGDKCSDTLLLTKGEIRFYSQENDFSDEVTLYTLKAGEQCLSKIMIGLEGTSFIPSAVAESEVEGFLVNAKELENFIKKVPSYQDYIISLYAKKMIELTKAIHHVKFKNLDERIMDFLEVNEKRTITITHSALANKMNTSRSVVSRVLKKLEEKGELKLYRGYIELT